MKLHASGDDYLETILVLKKIFNRQPVQKVLELLTKRNRTVQME